jgi:acyl carrier protein
MLMQDEVAQAFQSAMQLERGFLLQDSMTFQDVPGWDSVGHMNLIGELEKRFGVALEMEEIVALDSVGAVRELIARKQAA